MLKDSEMNTTTYVSQSAAKEILLKDENGIVTYYIEEVGDSRNSFKFIIWKVVEWGEDNNPFMDSLELMVHGTVNKDGSANLYFGDDGKLSFRGEKEYYDMQKILKAVWEKTFMEIVNIEDAFRNEMYDEVELRMRMKKNSDSDYGLTYKY